MKRRNIKAAFFDIDGTLVSFKTHKVPTSTVAAIRKLRHEGVKVFIATGRPLPFIRNLDEIEFDGIMSTNGAYCVTQSGEIICQYMVPKDDIRRMIESSRTNPIPVLFASNERTILCNSQTIERQVEEVFRLLDIPLPEKRPIEDALDMDVMQVIAFFKEEAEGHIMGEILQGCTAERWHPNFADCIYKGKNKATGIEEICRHYGFTRNDVIAFGDGGNDISMLQYAGLGIAMGNANQDVKKAADIVTASVDEDGIAIIVDKLIGEHQDIENITTQPR